ncbi:DUF302 domain-containing protein [Stappia sp. GBMRC 2046]|uniref:DUF302 domain-containing protein n=1 Tax=Stappia sediminis TaxID=2692190 RepID=A0A7X3LWT7_9HYPH|nr:DUF302 domain-containing protein [Stappia sediminis]MXN66596.1 DUF302 domain-containing protein [Stappia sediminis]
MRFATFALAVFFALANAASAEGPGPREGWIVVETAHSYPDLVERVQAAVKGQDMLLVTQASASGGAKAQGIAIPGNRVIGVYRNDFARRMLEASVASGIEAPIRFYVTENEDGTATLSYKTPSFVFSPYFDEGGEALVELARELDGIFEAIAKSAAE